MKKGTKKIERELKKEIEKQIVKHQNKKINIEKENYKTYFEVIDSTGILHTYDVAEGVAAIMMCEHSIDDNMLDILITEKDKKEISVSKALYWLTGGNNEWINSNNYKVDWHDASEIYKKKYGGQITRIVRKAKTIGDIKEKFEQNFNLVDLYEFAIENDLI